MTHATFLLSAREPPKEITEAPYRLLLLCVIHRAMQDAVGVFESVNVRNKSCNRRDAIEFLLGNDPGFLWICQSLGYDPGWMRKRIMSSLSDGGRGLKTARRTMSDPVEGSPSVSDDDDEDENSALFDEMFSALR